MTDQSENLEMTLQHAAKRASSAEARVAILEHALRYASQKFSWLAQYHLNAEYSKVQAHEIADKLWKVQARELTSMLGET